MKLFFAAAEKAGFATSVSVWRTVCRSWPALAKPTLAKPTLANFGDLVFWRNFQVLLLLLWCCFVVLLLLFVVLCCCFCVVVVLLCCVVCCCVLSCVVVCCCAQPPKTQTPNLGWESGPALRGPLVLGLALLWLWLWLLLVWTSLDHLPADNPFTGPPPPPDPPPRDRPKFRSFSSLSRHRFALSVSLWVSSR